MKNKTISEEYLNLQKQLHHNPYYGVTAKIYTDLILKIMLNGKFKSICDYGAGKKILYQSLVNKGFTNFDYFPYDPAFPEYGSPVLSDLVCCIDVMEHIEPDYLDIVIEEIKDITKYLCFFSIATLPATKSLSDGRNAHLIQKPPRWWLMKLCKLFDIEYLQLVPKKGFIVICKKINSL